MGQMAGNLGNKDVMDPRQAQWGDLDSSEKGARIFGGASKGLLNGVNQYEQQNAMMRQGGGMAPIAPVSQPQVSPEMFAPQVPQNPMTRKPGNNLNFYGGQ